MNYENLKKMMFNYEGNEAKIELFKNQIKFDAVLELSNEFEMYAESYKEKFINLTELLQQFAFNKFGYDYNKDESAIAYIQRMIELYD